MSFSPEPIAVIGSGCRFPGGANTRSQLWEVLKSAPNTAKRVPIDRFNLDRYYHPDGSHHGTCNVQESYFLEQDVRCFDAGFFSIPPGEAAAMDPQHRLLMETVYEAMEVAGLRLGDLQGSDTAAFVGVMVCLCAFLCSHVTDAGREQDSWCKAADIEEVSPRSLFPCCRSDKLQSSVPNPYMVPF
jgi:acyl transferase domain-containing protein